MPRLPGTYADPLALPPSYGTTEANFITSLPSGVPLVPGFVGCPALDVEVMSVQVRHRIVSPGG